MDYNLKEMDIVEIREFLVSLPEVEESQPFGDDNAVYRIVGKIFACISFVRPDVIALKCDPDRAVLLREKYSGISPAWHWNKKHWNDLNVSELKDTLIIHEIIHSYVTVINKNVTPKSERVRLQNIIADVGICDTEVELE